jgi:xanthine dehydrogenase accessory factor
MLAIEYQDFEKARQWLDTGKAIALVEVVEAAGSTPRGTGTAMVVADTGIAGTIGGGQLEWLAMAEARKLLASGDSSHAMSVALGPKIGQCCGGRVELRFSRIDRKLLDRLEAAANALRAGRNQVYIFGAGHTGMALASTLAPMPVDVWLIDSRPDALSLDDDRIRKSAAAIPESTVRKAKPGSAFAIMTHEHSLDFLITAEVLKRGDAAYCGMIGSATKRSLLKNWIMSNGYDRASLDKLTCPIGGAEVRDKRPQIIALLTAAEIVTALHRVHGEVIE